MNVSLLICLCLCFLALPPSARAENTPAAAASPNVAVTFTVFGFAGEIPGLGYKQGGKLKNMAVPAFVRSEVHSYSGPARMEVYATAAADADADAKPGEAKPIGTVTFKPDVKRYTVLIAGDQTGCQAVAVADDESQFPAGKVRLMNLCGFRMAVRCNQATTLTLDPGQAALVDPRDDHSLVTETTYEKNGKWRRANDDLTFAPPNAQTSIYFFPSEADYFQAIGGRTTRPIQMVVLRATPE